MNPKSGKAGNAVSPSDPKKAEDADKADPGEVDKIKAEQRQEQKGKYGAPKEKPHKPSKKKKSWIEIEMIDEADQPVSGEAYKITLPDGSVTEGTLDEKGRARIDGIDPGQCKITFTNLDKDAWEPA